MLPDVETRKGHKTIAIPPTAVRKEMGELMLPLLRKGNDGNPTAIGNQVARTGNLTIYRSVTDFGPDIACPEYLFGVELNDYSMLVENGHATADLFLAPFGLLSHCNYRPLSEKEDTSPGDIVVYRTEDPGPEFRLNSAMYGFGAFPIESLTAVHFGLYLGKGMVRSKFGGPSHVFEHPLAVVPEGFGDEAVFFRKGK